MLDKPVLKECTSASFLSSSQRHNQARPLAVKVKLESWIFLDEYALVVMLKWIDYVLEVDEVRERQGQGEEWDEAHVGGRRSSSGLRARDADAGSALHSSRLHCHQTLFFFMHDHLDETSDVIDMAQDAETI